MLINKEIDYLEGNSDGITVEEYKKSKAENLDRQYRLREISFIVLWVVGVFFAISFTVLILTYTKHHNTK